MNKLARYNHYNTTTKTIPSNVEEKKSFIVVDSIPSDYTDVTNIIEINNNGLLGCIDYLGVHFLMKNYFYQNKSWTTLSNEEKFIVIDNAFYSNFYEPNADINKITFLMSSEGGSLTQEEAIEYLITAYSRITVLISESCTIRANSKELMNVIGKYLQISEALDLHNSIRELIQDYKEIGLIGTDYSDSNVAAITDFISSKVGTIYEFSGLASKGYAINAPYTLQNLIDAFLDLLVRKH